MRLDEDLEALFVFSRGPRKRIAAFPGDLFSSKLVTVSPATGPDLTHPDFPISVPGTWLGFWTPGCQPQEGKGFLSQADEWPEVARAAVGTRSMRVSDKPRGGGLGSH